MKGGWMSEKYLDVYARYLWKFLQGYAQAGVPVHALRSQNEIVTTQYGRMPACRWSPELEAVFIRDHLGPLLRAQHQPTQIWLLDHNYSYYERVASQLQDQAVGQVRGRGGMARLHGYTGSNESSAPKRSEHPLLLDGGRSLYRRRGLLHRLGQVGRHLHRRTGELVPLRDYMEPGARSPG